MPHFNQVFLTDAITTHGSFLIWFLCASMLVLSGVCMSAVGFFSWIVGSNYHWSAPLESNKLEISWIVGPIVVVCWMGYWNTLALYSQSAIGNVDFTVCVTGHQWYWEYTLNFNEDFKFNYMSYATPLNDLSSSEVYLLSADYPLVIPGGSVLVSEGSSFVRKVVRVRLLITSADVLHAFSVPSLSVKADACPGRINEVVIMPRLCGTYYGQCSELCGRLHSAMPINVEVISPSAYIAFLKKNMERLS